MKHPLPCLMRIAGRLSLASSFWIGVAALSSAHLHAAEPLRAMADLVSCTNTPLSGTVALAEAVSNEGIRQVSVSVQIVGLSPRSVHATHIHQTASCAPCGSAGGHFDPGPESNTSPDGNHPFHSGDLPNLRVNDKGIGVMQTVTSRVTLSDGPLSLFDADGSAIIIHDNADTFCPEGDQPGCAGGSRAACGIIRLVDSTEAN